MRFFDLPPLYSRFPVKLNFRRQYLPRFHSHRFIFSRLGVLFCGKNGTAWLNLAQVPYFKMSLCISSLCVPVLKLLTPADCVYISHWEKRKSGATKNKHYVCKNWFVRSSWTLNSLACGFGWADFWQAHYYIIFTFIKGGNVYFNTSNNIHLQWSVYFESYFCNKNVLIANGFLCKMFP